jgi:hypothetical protein
MSTIDVDRPGAAPAGDPNMVALLGLKILLLGFFILLNALSHFEEDRARRVLQSVDRAFNGRVDAVRSEAPTSAALGPLDDAEAVMDAVGELFTSLIPAVRSEVSARGTRLRLELPVGSLFRADSTALQSGRGVLMKRFAEALTRNGRDRFGYQVELLHGIAREAAPGLIAAGAESLEIRRTAVLVAALTKRGVAPDKLSVGVVPGRPGKVQLVVQIYESAVPALDYGELVR